MNRAFTFRYKSVREIRDRRRLCVRVRERESQIRKCRAIEGKRYDKLEADNGFTLSQKCCETVPQHVENQLFQETGWNCVSSFLVHGLIASHPWETVGQWISFKHQHINLKKFSKISRHNAQSSYVWHVIHTCVVSSTWNNHIGEFFSLEMNEENKMF